MREARRGLLRRALAVAGLAVACWLAFVYVIRQPRNDRDWEVGFERLASTAISGQELEIRNARDYRVVGRGTFQPGFVDRSIPLDAIERAWFVFEPFQVLPIEGFRGVAHTYFVFDVRGQPPITVSVEARREKGEQYSAWWGLWHEYELMYVWATEEDQTIKRVVDQGNAVYMFPLTIPREWTISLVEGLARTTADLEREARFYNTLRSNCTNELAWTVNSLRPGTIPFGLAWVLPGYSIDTLHELGYIPNDRPLSEIRQRYDVTDIVRRVHAEPDFSVQLRAYLDS